MSGAALLANYDSHPHIALFMRASKEILEAKMSDDLPSHDSSSWSDVLQQLNIPKLIAGPAGEVISRLVGHAVDVPSEYIKNIKQGIQDRREARTEVSKALAKAVAMEVVEDRELLRRAAQSFLAKELRSQANKESGLHPISETR
jgi:hypothetical protein